MAGTSLPRLRRRLRTALLVAAAVAGVGLAASPMLAWATMLASDELPFDALLTAAERRKAWSGPEAAQPEVWIDRAFATRWLELVERTVGERQEQVQRAGWPWRCVEGRLLFEGAGPRSVGAVRMPQQVTLLGPAVGATPPATMGMTRRLWPLAPLWGGLALDVVVLGGAPLLAWGVWRSLRGVWRAVRGRCPACGYPRGRSDRCTECGRRFRSRGRVQSSTGTTKREPS
ncbi:MAG: hypothetical protein ACYTJ0_08005 [Planctomycetota bacterium]|jgi:hypothetical protein